MSVRSRIAWGLALCASASGLAGLCFVVLNDQSFDEIVTGYAGAGVVLGLSFSLVGGLVAARRPDNPIGWVFLAVGISQGLDTFVTNYGEYALEANPTLFGGAEALWMAQWTYAPGAALVGTITLLLFPTGRAPSRRWHWVIWAIVGATVLLVVPMAVATWSLRGSELLALTQETASGEVALALGLQEAGLMIVAVCMIASVGSLFVRFRRAPNLERQQLKWLTYAAVITVAVLIADVSLVELGRTPGGALWTAINSVLLVTAVPSIPVAVGVAILKYRLYDIDRVINRTLVYMIVSGAALAVYAATVFVISTIAVGSGDNLTVAAATLAAAAAFRPLLIRVQGFVDQRFYRHKYDAQKTIDAFGSRLREETNLDELTDDLVSVVRTTMQPSHVSLWMKTLETGS
jgi:hypothetical protein